MLNYAPRTLQPDMMSLWPPTEVAEGYQYETVRENYTLTDGARTMSLSYVQPLAHVEGMLMAYLPTEKMVIQADLYDPPAAGFLQSRAAAGPGCRDHRPHPRARGAVVRLPESRTSPVARMTP